MFAVAAARRALRRGDDVAHHDECSPIPEEYGMPWVRDARQSLKTAHRLEVEKWASAIRATLGATSIRQPRPYSRLVEEDLPVFPPPSKFVDMVFYSLDEPWSRDRICSYLFGRLLSRDERLAAKNYLQTRQEVKLDLELFRAHDHLRDRQTIIVQVMVMGTSKVDAGSLEWTCDMCSRSLKAWSARVECIEDRGLFFCPFCFYEGGDSPEMAAEARACYTTIDYPALDDDEEDEDVMTLDNLEVNPPPLSILE